MGLEDDFLLADADDEKTIEFIKNYLPQELKEKFSDDELYYFLDLIDEYYSESGILDAQPDEDGYVDIDFLFILFHLSAVLSDQTGNTCTAIRLILLHQPDSGGLIRLFQFCLDF